MVGFGRFGQIVSQPLLLRGIDVSIIDNDVEMIQAAARFGFKVYYGDGTRLDILHAAGAGSARAVLICVDKGDGICAVEIETAPGRLRTVQVPFRVFTKRELYVLKAAGQKGDAIGPKDIVVRETYMNGKGSGYPTSVDDVVGKVLKRDVPANTLVTDQILEDRIVVRRGDAVTIIAESDKLVVRTKGKTVDKGRMGDVIRVKNTVSGKEVMAKVVSSSSVKVEF